MRLSVMGDAEQLGNGRGDTCLRFMGAAKIVQGPELGMCRDKSGRNVLEREPQDEV